MYKHISIFNVRIIWKPYLLLLRSKSCVLSKVFGSHGRHVHVVRACNVCLITYTWASVFLFFFSAENVISKSLEGLKSKSFPGAVPLDPMPPMTLQLFSANLFDAQYHVCVYFYVCTSRCRRRSSVWLLASAFLSFYCFLFFVS